MLPSANTIVSVTLSMPTPLIVFNIESVLDVKSTGSGKMAGFVPISTSMKN